MFDEIFPILASTDLGRALIFYRDSLGGQVNYQFPEEGAPSFVALGIGASTIGIAEQDSPAPTTNDRISLWVYTSDCDAAIDRLRADGAPVLLEPTDQPWGERMAMVSDPDGNRVMIATRG
jgi:lactoylglutathione lyase